MTDTHHQEAGREAERRGSGGSAPSGGAGAEPLLPHSASSARDTAEFMVIDRGIGDAVAYFVVSAQAGPFATHAEAWRRIDRHQGEPISTAEKRSDWITSKILGGSAA